MQRRQRQRGISGRKNAGIGDMKGEPDRAQEDENIPFVHFKRGTGKGQQVQSTGRQQGAQPRKPRNRMLEQDQGQEGHQNDR